MQILFVTTWFPYPADNGSKLRQYHLLKGLASRHGVHLLSLCAEPVAEPYPSPLVSLCQSIETVQARPYLSRGPRALLAFASQAPRSYAATYSHAMASALRRRLREPFDLVIFCQMGLLPYSHLIGSHSAIWDEIELGNLYQVPQRQPGRARKLRKALMCWKMTRYMRARSHHFAAGTVVSEPEQRLAHSLLGNAFDIRVVPNGVDAAHYPAAIGADSRRLLFAGSLAYPVNLDAMQFFVRDIYPLIREQVPDVSLHITGARGNAPWPPGLVDESVQLTGYLPDIAAFTAQCALSIAPIRTGGGTRLKILEAMAIGTPVVSTSKGAEGLAVCNERHLLIADEPAGFAQAVVRLLRDGSLRQSLATNARALVAEQYDWAVVLPRYLDWLQEVATVDSRRVGQNA